MRIIKASSVDSPSGIELVDIDPDGSEPYAILSHTWGSDEDEVTYKDILGGTAHRKATYEYKLAASCRRTLAEGYDYVWIDTCCIDKTSSAELSEAINSMFLWYQKSSVCFALLSDVSGIVDMHDPHSPFAKARWFTRGFTLQELLAPANVVFYSRNWYELGNKVTLSSAIATITGVDVQTLKGERPIEAASVANRMGWVANRSTKRPEDLAYCLMGIFSVNMPLLYGEGRKAFIRLQEEIMKSSTDHSIFAWIDEDAPDDNLRGVLATSPWMFRKTRLIRPYRRWEGQRPYSVTNMGLSIFLPVNEITGEKDLYVACFDCPSPAEDGETMFGIFIRKLDEGTDDMRFARVKAAKVCPVTAYQYSKKSAIYLSTTATFQQSSTLPISLFASPLVQLEQKPTWSGYMLRSVTIFPGGHIYKRLGPAAAQERWPLQLFYLRQGAGKVSCAILIREVGTKAETAQSLLVLIGTAGHDSSLAYHVVHVDDELGVTDTKVDHVPDVHELEAFYHQPKPPGQSIQSRNNMVQLTADVGVAGGYYHIGLSVRKCTPSEMEPPKAVGTAESAGSKLKKQFSKIGIMVTK